MLLLAVPFEHAVDGGSFRTCCCWRFLSNMLLLAVLLFLASLLLLASLHADAGVPILVGGFTYWIVE
jgi:hypothetical protein